MVVRARKGGRPTEMRVFIGGETQGKRATAKKRGRDANPDTIRNKRETKRRRGQARNHAEEEEERVVWRFRMVSEWSSVCVRARGSSPLGGKWLRNLVTLMVTHTSREMGPGSLGSFPV